MHTSDIERKPKLKWRVLVVDDEQDVLDVVRNTILGTENTDIPIHFEVCTSVAEVEELVSPERNAPPFHVCLLDILFMRPDRQETLTEFQRLFDLIKKHSPEISILELSNVAFSQAEATSLSGIRITDIDARIPKRAFYRNQSLLIRELLGLLEKKEDLYLDFIQEVRPYLKQREQELYAGPSVLLFEITGHVLEIHGDLVEVRIERCEGLENPFKNLTGAKPERLMLRYDVLKHKGLLGHGEAFRYRVVRRGSEITSSVEPLNGERDHVQPQISDKLRRLSDLEAGDHERFKKRLTEKKEGETNG